MLLRCLPALVLVAGSCLALACSFARIVSPPPHRLTPVDWLDYAGVLVFAVCLLVGSLGLRLAARSAR